ncbi:hypothetical protein, partial [Citrobacter portucalensis]
LGLFLRTAVNDFMDSVHHIWCPLSSQEYQDLPDGAETTLTDRRSKPEYLWLRSWGQSNGKKTLPDGSISQ